MRTRKIIYTDKNGNKHELYYPIVFSNGVCTGEHKYKQIVNTPPTCAEKGLEVYTCRECHNTYTKYKESPGHVWSEWILDTSTNTDSRTCSGCGSTEERPHQFSYTQLTDKTYSVKVRDGVTLTGNIVIPSTYKGKEVTQIDFSGFEGRNEITSVIIPEGVKSIGSMAFYNCNNLVSIVIPKTVNEIGTLTINNTSFTTVYYGGTEAEWANVTIEMGNDMLKKATFYYYSKTEPTDDGNYWHLVNGEPFAWYYCGDNHTWGDWVIIEEATCFTEGLKSRICDKCGHIEEKTISITHSFGEWYVHTEPTCTNVGVKRKDCDCGEYETEIIEKLDHVSSDWIIDKEATEDEMGTKHTECIHCGVVLKEVTFSNLDFTRPSSYGLFRISNSRPNEQTNTYAIWAYNAGTNYPIKVDKVTILPKLTLSEDKIHHIGESAFREAKANSGSGGFKIGIPYTIETIDRNAFEESYVEEVIFEEHSKLKKIDYKAFYGCWALKKIALPPSVEWICEGAFNGTAFEEIYLSKSVITVEPRVFADMPSNCTIYVEAESKPEGWADDWCDETIEVFWGRKEDGSCSHSYGAWTTTSRPTCEMFGNMQRKCSICGDIEIAPIDPLGHNYEDVITTEPTCLTSGVKTSTCKRCGNVKTSHIPHLGHDWDKGFVRIEPTCNTNGVRRHTCTRCGDIADMGISALRHDWGEWKVVHPAECEIDGMRERKCTRCNDVEFETIKAEGHDWDIDVEVVEPTCTESGYTIHKCNNCTETYIDSYTDPIGHNIVDGVCTRCHNGKKGIVYYGVSAIPESYDNTFILGLSHSTPSDAHLASISTRPLAGEYIYYCAPTSFGDCAFIYNNFVGGFSLIREAFSFTDANGKTEAYNIYKSNRANLGVNGAITITIKEMG